MSEPDQPPWLMELLPILACPDCREAVKSPEGGTGVVCTACGRHFAVENGILVMLPLGREERPRTGRP